MDTYPTYITQMLQQARALLKDENHSVSEAAGICFDILASFPDCTEASELILRGFSQPWLIRDTRRAISRLIDEWDDRPYQQRHRLALSFSYFTESDHWKIEIEEERHEKLTDVLPILKEGDRQLLQAYLSGIDRATEVAWAIFQAGIQRAEHPREVILWVANNYAHRGFFGDAVDILETVQPGLLDDQIRRLWAEVRWWRDHQHHIPWMPPEGDGSRYEKYLAKFDPERLAFEKSATPLSRQYRPPDLSKLPSNFVLPQPISEELEAQIDQILRASPPVSSQEMVDWSYLTQLESGEVDISQFPRWARELLEEIDDPELRAQCAADFLERFSNPEALSEEEEEENDDEI